MRVCEVIQVSCLCGNRADGGVCTNDFVMQLTADLLGLKIARPSHFDMSALGAAFMAGLGVGMGITNKNNKQTNKQV